ncbi:DNA mismatch endonuclease (patch repair protein) [Curtobacterium flaccumfaciens]|uniref:DNA mismatch endonuclease (Patch repair protein) n=1 Tax=Curtobacterium salicis TaxID=1779862 RepID=A0ABX0T8U9_9MICO|nr:very short patch repair endonuclease [Curtobacterium sp. WW7]NII40235.1 DNA mismatch endonuclease (patch repair protein) [Curtobacterium sp. WW7]
MQHWEADEHRSRHMARFGRRDTAPELALRRALHGRGRRFFVDRRISSRTRARGDLVFPRARVAVFVDGCFWHWCEEHAHLPKANAELWRAKLLANRRRDASHDAVLRAEGWRVIRIWEHEDVTAAADLVEAALDRWDRITSRRSERAYPTAANASRAPAASSAGGRPYASR